MSMAQVREAGLKLLLLRCSGEGGSCLNMAPPTFVKGGPGPPNIWASEASPTLGCSSVIYIYNVYMLSVCLVCQINCVGGITWTKHVHAQSLFLWRLNQ